MELIVKAAEENELNQEGCISYWKDSDSGEVRCGCYW